MALPTGLPTACSIEISTTKGFNTARSDFVNGCCTAYIFNII